MHEKTGFQSLVVALCLRFKAKMQLFYIPLTNDSCFFLALSLCLGVLVAVVIVHGQSTQDPTYGGLFTTAAPYVDLDEYFPPENKQDKFDWHLTKVRRERMSRVLTRK
jgi:hypothetical protein